MALYKQDVTPNLDPIAYDDGKMLTDWYGECLATERAAFNAPYSGKTAWIGWTSYTQFKHEDQDFPTGVYFPLWFKGANGAGHACFAFINAQGVMTIWTSPYQHIPYFFTGYHTIAALEKGYGITFVGWSEDIAGMRIIEPIPEPLPLPVPPPILVSHPYTVEDLPAPKTIYLNKQPTQEWNLDDTVWTAFTANPVATFDSGTPKEVVAIATHNLGGGYYMTDRNIAAGYNIMDCNDSPPTSAPVATPATDPAPAVVDGLATTNAPMTDVKAVTPADDPDAWKKATKNVADYRATQDYAVEDLVTGAPATDLLQDQIVHAAVRRTKPDANGHPVEYVFTQKNEDKGTYNGVPLAVLELIKPFDIEEDDKDSLLDEVYAEAAKAAGKISGIVVGKIKSDASLRAKLVDLIGRWVFHVKKQKNLGEI